ncbi:MAG: hypothetical protein RJA06_74, partial [Bacteroidota bacterium]
MKKLLAFAVVGALAAACAPKA